MASHFAELQDDIEDLGPVSAFVDEFVDVVKSLPWMEHFDPQEANVLTDHMDCFGVPRQSVVLREGDDGDFLAILLTGKAMITKSLDGVSKMIQEVKPGDVIGEMSLIDGQKRFASCITTEPSDFAVLTLQNFKSLLEHHPRLGNKLLLMLLRLTSSRLRRATTLVLPDLRDASL
jgi:CRP-like cAMP-binding protein